VRDKLDTLAERERADLTALLDEVDAYGIRHNLRRLVFAVDIVTGLMWLLVPPDAFSGPTYKPVRALMGWLPYEWQFRPIGALLLVTSFLIWVTRNGHREMYYLLAAILIFHWVFWACMLGFGALVDASHRGVIIPWMCLFIAGCHQVLLASSSRSR
jgi:hypothetical protein